MGYRSKVLIAIKKEKINQEFKGLEILEDVNKITKFEKYFTFLWEEIKWYEGYDTICMMTSFLESLESEDYGFLRIGEDDEDIEKRGDPYLYNCYIDRVFDFNEKDGDENTEEFFKCNAAKFIEGDSK